MNVNELIAQAWHTQSHTLMQGVVSAIAKVEDLLTLERHYQEGHTSQALASAVGDFGGATLNVDAMSSVLGHQSEGSQLDPARAQRIKAMLKELEAIRTASAPTYRTIGFDAAATDIQRQCEEHLNAMAKIFRLIRLAHIEAQAKYRPAWDALFAQFHWRHLNDAELRVCPPCVVVGHFRAADEGDVAKALVLLSQEMPIKLVLQQTTFQTHHIDLLPLVSPHAYLLQTTAMDAELTTHLARGLSAPSPALFSIYWGDTQDAAYADSAEKAKASRAFPHIVFDPDASAHFGSCLNLSGNPEVEQLWPRIPLTYRSDTGNESLERAYTYADFAAEDAHQQDQFQPVTDQTESRLIPLADFLELAPTQRMRKTPYVLTTDAKQHLVKRIPSLFMINKTAARRQRWKSLQEQSGINNPHVNKAEQQLRQELTTHHEESLTQLRVTMEAQMQSRSKEAVTAAMKQLALKLAGMGGSALSETVATTATPPPSATPPQAAPATAPKAVEALASRPASDALWIETKLCTTCDECTTINKRIFAYDKNKQAIVKDPKGGPFKDIVKAAEKCPVRIIHPGKPSDPKEKNVDKLIERAKPFQ